MGLLVSIMASTWINMSDSVVMTRAELKTVRYYLGISNHFLHECLKWMPEKCSCALRYHHPISGHELRATKLWYSM